MCDKEFVWIVKCRKNFVEFVVLKAPDLLIEWLYDKLKYDSLERMILL